MIRTPLQDRQFNERVRTAIALLSNGGLALFGAFAAVLYSGSGGDDALGMAILGLFLISGSFAASALLREEA
ncbi:MAG TPA: hypothetical protein VGW40_11635 [Allosphingosinicella sp.]|nr:hypothetical protein [Allosphingosinicella sp.]